MYETVLLSYLFGEIDWEIFLVKLKNLKRSENRKILSSILLNFHENLKGGMKDKIPEIFVNLGLNKDAYKATKSKFYFKKVWGIRQLMFLDTSGAIKIMPE